MDESKIKVYGYRWVVLGVFMLINMTIQFLWICFAPITGLAAKYYGVTDMQIGILAMLFMIVYIPIGIPAAWFIDTYGFLKGVGLGAVLFGIFGLLRGIFSSSYTLVLLCTIGIAVAQPFLLNAFTTVAAKWFPINERATASGLGLMANFLGTAVGLMLTPYLVTRYSIDAMQMIYGISAALSAGVFLIFAREKPPTSPSPPGYIERALMFDGFKSMMRSLHFWYLMILFFVGVGIFNGVATWVENIVRPKGLSITQAGMVGGLLLIGGIIGAVIIPPLSDYWRKRKPFMLIGTLFTLPGVLGIAFGHGYPILLVSAFCVGFFMISLAPVALQYAAEITYPAPEGTSNGLLQLAGQLSVIFIYGMGLANDIYGSFTPAMLLACGLLVMNFMLITRLKESKIIKEMARPAS